MSFEYDCYISEHKDNVMKAYKWIKNNIPEVLKPNINYDAVILNHDSSKTNIDEYKAYDKYYYGDNVSYADKQEYKKAWLTHIHRNPHHWEHWILIQDNGETEILEMPHQFIIEMICDWWSFSFRQGELDEIFKWYYDHENIQLHPNTKKEVEYVLDSINKKIKE